MRIQRRLPSNINPNDVQYFDPHLEIDLPSLGCRMFEHYVAVYSNGIVFDKWRFDRESLLYDARLKDKGLKLYLTKLTLKAFLKRNVCFCRPSDTLITIINEWSNNYFHWLTEALPKLVVAMDLGFMPTVMLPSHYQSLYQYRSLALLGIKYQLFREEIVIAKNVILPNRLAPYSAQYNPSIMRRLAQLLKDPVNLNVNFGSRLYVSRKNATRRKVVNEDDVMLTLSHFGFKTVLLEDLCLDEQIAIMHNASAVVSIHGAGLTNIIFCQPGTNVLELCLENQTLDKCFFNLANAMDLNYYYQFCKSTKKPHNYFSSDLVVDLVDLVKNINKFIGHDNG